MVVTLTLTPEAPQVQGTPIVLTARAEGGSGDYEYEFYQEIGQRWIIVQHYSRDSTWTWDSSGAETGSYYFTVYARSIGSTAPYDAARWRSYQIRNPVVPLTGIPAMASLADSVFGPMPPLVPIPDEWPVLRESVHRTIQSFLGVGPKEIPPLNPELVETTLLEDHIRKKVRYQVAPGESVPAYLLLPLEGGLPRPAVLVLHQSVACGMREPVGLEGNPEQAIGLDLVRRGYIVLAPDLITAGERVGEGEPFFDTASFYDAHPDWSAVGKMLWDHQRGIDYLQSLPEVDGKRIGAIGTSLGGSNAYFLAAFDERVQAVVSVCAQTRIETDPERMRWARGSKFVYMPALRPYLLPHSDLPLPWDIQHLAALIWPRAHHQVFALRDTMYPPVPFTDPLPDPFLSTSVTIAQVHMTLLPLYRFQGRERHLQAHCYDAGHGFPVELHESAYSFLDSVLMGRQGSE